MRKLVRMSENVRKGEKPRGFPWFGIGFVILVLAGVGLLFTSIPGKVSRHLREIIGSSRKQGDGAEGRTLALQVEQRLRAEYDEKLKRELFKLCREYKTQMVGARYGKKLRAGKRFPQELRLGHERIVLRKNHPRGHGQRP